MADYPYPAAITQEHVSMLTSDDQVIPLYVGQSVEVDDEFPDIDLAVVNAFVNGAKTAGRVYLESYDPLPATAFTAVTNQQTPLATVKGPHILASGTSINVRKVWDTHATASVRVDGVEIQGEINKSHYDADGQPTGEADVSGDQAVAGGGQ